MYTLGAGRILIKSIIIVCLLNLMAWKASWGHRTGEIEKKNDKIKKSVQTSSACGTTPHFVVVVNVLLPICCHTGSGMPNLRIFVEDIVALLGAMTYK